MIMEAIKRRNALEIPVVGKLDMQSARMFEHDFMEKYLNGSEEVIALNMSNLKFLDSSGLSILMKLNNEAKKVGKTIYYLSFSSTMLNVIKIARLDNILHFMDEEEFNRKYPVL